MGKGPGPKHRVDKTLFVSIVIQLVIMTSKRQRVSVDGSRDVIVIDAIAVQSLWSGESFHCRMLVEPKLTAVGAMGNTRG